MSVSEEKSDLMPLEACKAELLQGKIKEIDDDTSNNDDAVKWGGKLEFLFSCISLSVGLGNIWRFPYIAFQNGGGTFVIPYLIVLLIIGRPIYFLEVVLGQFSGRGSIKTFDFAPLLKGVAAGQVIATIFSITYYSSIMALTLRFLIASFSKVLPWSYCRSKWGDICSDGINNSSLSEGANKMSPAELYFQREILHEISDIDNGIGMPNVELVGCLFVAWLVIGAVLIKGIKSSGKVAYFLGVFPYVVLIILLIRAVTLPGALNGIIYFFKPRWIELLNPLVWYAAVTQVFFSLAICFGTLITYASYNEFSRNIYNDIVIITTMDSCSSIIAGCITFGILGNLLHESGGSDIASVVKGGAGLAFISYPDAIAKFHIVPQAFAVLFFLMLFVLGIGSTVGMGSCILRVIQDQFGTNQVSSSILALGLTIIGFGISIVYTTPGGQFVLNLVDFYGVSFTALILAIGELFAVAWIYGGERLCEDVEFMMGRKLGFYWRFCWSFLTPGLMLSVLIYNLVDFTPLTYKDVQYPAAAHAIGWCMVAAGLLQVPGWALYAILKQKSKSGFVKKLFATLKPTPGWGPSDKKNYQKYTLHCRQVNINTTQAHGNIFIMFKRRIFG